MEAIPTDYDNDDGDCYSLYSFDIVEVQQFNIYTSFLQIIKILP